MSLGSVSLAIISARSSFAQLFIGNPPGYENDFMELDYGVFDLKLWSLVRGRLLKEPYELQEMKMDGLHVNIEQRADGNSNCRIILHHLNQATRTAFTLPGPLAAVAHAVPTPA